MVRPVTLFTGQWADLPFETMCRQAKDFGYDGLEIGCWGQHLDVEKAAANDGYSRELKSLLAEYQLAAFAISNHLVGQAVCDQIDARHQAILPARIFGDGHPEGVRQRAAQEMIATGYVAKAMGVKTVVGFTGSAIWPYLYAFPPLATSTIDDGFRDFAARWRPILDEYQKLGLRFALEVHPTEIAFDLVTAQRALQALDYHPAFGFNFDPSHLGYQGVDYVRFLYEFSDRIFHVHVKDVAWAKAPGVSGVFGGHLAFGDPRRAWDFRSPGRGDIDFESVIRALNHIGYTGPLSVEWEDSGMAREVGAREAAAFVRRLDFAPPKTGAFDDAFAAK